MIQFHIIRKCLFLLLLSLIQVSSVYAFGDNCDWLKNIPEDSLRTLATSAGLPIGNAVNVNALNEDEIYKQILAEQFSSVTAENAMKWSEVEPVQGEYNWAPADELVAFAQENKQLVRGHVLVWHNQLPTWLEEGYNNGDITNEEMEEILHQHVIDEVTHFKGKIWHWDVVNEAFEEDGSLRDTIWLQALGKDYIAKTFSWAHEADPKAKLYYNDYNLGYIGAKSDAAYKLLQELIADGVPIHGVGFQGHMGMQYGMWYDMVENMRRFAKLGLEIALTEVDVRILLLSEDIPEQEAQLLWQDKLMGQAHMFTHALQACLAVKQCVSFTVWGLSDAHSWVPDVFPEEGAATLYDENYEPKPAYKAVQQTLSISRGTSVRRPW
ncbi:MAG: endo-1,4-beta-xylanase [Desulfobacteraceae bacterium]|jgi:endo-1,4-beta-xylanase